MVAPCLVCGVWSGALPPQASASASGRLWGVRSGNHFLGRGGLVGFPQKGNHMFHGTPSFHIPILLSIYLWLPRFSGTDRSFHCPFCVSSRIARGWAAASQQVRTAFFLPAHEEDRVFVSAKCLGSMYYSSIDRNSACVLHRVYL